MKSSRARSRGCTAYTFEEYRDCYLRRHGTDQADGWADPAPGWARDIGRRDIPAVGVPFLRHDGTVGTDGQREGTTWQRADRRASRRSGGRAEPGVRGGPGSPAERARCSGPICSPWRGRRARLRADFVGAKDRGVPLPGAPESRAPSRAVKDLFRVREDEVPRVREDPQPALRCLRARGPRPARAGGKGPGSGLRVGGPEPRAALRRGREPPAGPQCH